MDSTRRGPVFPFDMTSMPSESDWMGLSVPEQSGMIMLPPWKWRPLRLWVAPSLVMAMAGRKPVASMGVEKKPFFLSLISAAK